MLKKKVSWLLSLVLVLTLALSFSLDAEAGSRVYGAPQTYTRTINLSRDGISHLNTHPVFNVRKSADNFIPSSTIYTSITDTYFDYYVFSNVDGLFQPDINYDGYLISVLFSGSKFNFSNTGAFSVALGSNSSVADDVSLSVNNSPYWASSTLVDYNCAIYGYDYIYIWLHGESAHYQHLIKPTSSGGSTTTYSAFDVNITMQITVYPYVDSQASSVDINNQTNSINNNINQATQNQTNSINNNINQATQNQTNTLTGGYDNSGMENTNKQLADSLASYDQTESQVTDQSVGYIDAVSFFDPTTHLQLMTSITYVSTFLQNLFVALGDWSVLVMISLSLAFALMLIGWFKYRK